MFSISKGQLMAIGGVSLLFVALLFANRIAPSKNLAEVKSENGNADLSKIISASKAQLPEDKKKILNELEEKVQSSAEEDRLPYLDTLIRFCDKSRQPYVAAFYAEQKADADPSKGNWFDAGNRYYMITKFTKDQERALLFSKAILCYNHALDLSPKDLDLKTSLGICYVEGTAEPMKGIGLLRDVVAADSNHVDAQLNLGLFAVKSGQYDKAVARFKKVLAIDHNNLEMYLYLADCYEKSGNKRSAIESLEKYRDLVTDVTVKNEVQNYINKLTN